MICTGVQGQTLLDFYLTLKSRNSVDLCRGPIVYLEMNEPTASRMLEACTIAGLENRFSIAFITQSVEDRGLFGSCVAHWLDVIYAIGVVGVELKREDLIHISDLTAFNVCDVLEWDVKELSNYLKSLSSGQTSS